MKNLNRIIIVFFVFSVVLVSFPQIKEVNAQEPIYIRADGSVEGTDKIQRDGNLYTFTGDIYDSIIVERENIVIDGSGYLLQGNNTEYGIKIESSGVTIKNTQISRFEYGIYLYLSSNNNIIVDNNITGNSRGIYVRGTDNNTITSNIIYRNEVQASQRYGIIESGTSNFNVMIGNTVRNNYVADIITVGANSTVNLCWNGTTWVP